MNGKQAKKLRRLSEHLTQKTKELCAIHDKKLVYGINTEKKINRDLKRGKLVTDKRQEYEKEKSEIAKSIANLVFKPIHHKGVTIYDLYNTYGHFWTPQISRKAASTLLTAQFESLAKEGRVRIEVSENPNTPRKYYPIIEKKEQPDKQKIIHETDEIIVLQVEVTDGEEINVQELIDEVLINELKEENEMIKNDGSTDLPQAEQLTKDQPKATDSRSQAFLNEILPIIKRHMQNEPMTALKAKQLVPELQVIKSKIAPMRDDWAETLGQAVELIMKLAA